MNFSIAAIRCTNCHDTGVIIRHSRVNVVLACFMPELVGIDKVANIFESLGTVCSQVASLQNEFMGTHFCVFDFSAYKHAVFAETGAKFISYRQAGNYGW